MKRASVKVNRNRLSLVRVLTALTPILLAACESRETAAPTPPPAHDLVMGTPGEIPLVPGPRMADFARFENPYSGNSAIIADGQRLYTWYNCGGCHGGLGGGGMGPPLRDDQWIYGSDPISVYRSIMQGRPEGMPGWIGKIPDDQVWRIVAFIEALGQGEGGEPPLSPPQDRVSSGPSNEGANSPTEP